MSPATPSPTDRTSFDSAMSTILAEHATLRHLAFAAIAPTSGSDEALSLADAMIAHESAEARLFDLPFLTRQPALVASTSARARQRCLEYTSGTFHLPDPGAAIGLFVDALLAHLAAEEAWLAREREHQIERLHISA